MTDDLVTVVSLDTRKLTAGVKDARAELAKADAALDKVDDAAKDAAKSLDKMGNEASATGAKAAAATSKAATSFDRLKLAIDNAARANELIGKVGMLAGGGAVLALLAGAVRSAVEPFRAMVEATRDAATRLDELTAGMTDARSVALAPYVESLRDLNAEMERTARVGAETRIVLTSLASDAVTELDRATRGASAAVRDLALAYNESPFARAAAGGVREALFASLPTGVQAFLAVANAGVTAVQMYGDAAGDASGEVSGLADQAERLARALEAGARVPIVPQGPLQPGTAFGTGGGVYRTGGGGARGGAPRPDFAGDIYAAQQAGLEESIAAQVDAENAALKARAEIRAQELAEYAEYAAERKRLDEEAAAASVAAAQQAAAQQQALTGQVLQLAQASTGAIFGAIQAQQQATADGSVESFRQQQTTAIAQTAIAGLLAVAQGFAQLGPIGGAAAAVGLVGTIAGLASSIQAVRPPAVQHDGGLQPSEMMATTRVLSGEMQATYSRRAVDAMGGPGAVADVARTGRVRGQGETRYYFIDRSQIYGAREVAAPALLTGRRRRG